MAAASAASGVRTWLQSSGFRWLTPRRLRRLTLAAMCAAGLVSSLGVSGSGAASTPHPAREAGAHRSAVGP
jgi:O-antigen ligase